MFERGNAPNDEELDQLAHIWQQAADHPPPEATENDLVHALTYAQTGHIPLAAYDERPDPYADVIDAMGAAERGETRAVTTDDGLAAVMAEALPAPAGLEGAPRVNPQGWFAPDAPVGEQLAMMDKARIAEQFFERPIPPGVPPRPPRLPPPRSTLKPDATPDEQKALMQEILSQTYEGRYGMAPGADPWPLFDFMIREDPDTYNKAHDLVYGAPFRSKDWGPQPPPTPNLPDPSPFDRLMKDVWDVVKEGPGLPDSFPVIPGNGGGPGTGTISVPTPWGEMIVPVPVIPRPRGR